MYILDKLIIIAGSVRFHEVVSPSKILFLPQKPYFTDGTLKQQVSHMSLAVFTLVKQVQVLRQVL